MLYIFRHGPWSAEPLIRAIRKRDIPHCDSSTDELASFVAEIDPKQNCSILDYTHEDLTHSAAWFLSAPKVQISRITTQLNRDFIDTEWRVVVEGLARSANFKRCIGLEDLSGARLPMIEGRWASYAFLHGCGWDVDAPRYAL